MRSAAAALVLAVASCGSEPVRDAPDVVRDEAVDTSSRPAVDRSTQRKIIAFGDSLTAGFGIGQDEAYPAMLQKLVDEAGYRLEVVNAGVSGETSAGGVRRIDWVLQDRDVAVVIVELGGNDGLRGLPPQELKKNLSTIIDGAATKGIPVLLAGLSAGEDPGMRYIRELVAVYQEIAAERDVTFMPNFLEGVAGVEALNQSDGKHPNAEGARVVAENVWKYLEPMLSTDTSDPR